MFWAIPLFITIFYVIGFRWKNRKLFKLYEQLKCGMKSYAVVGHAYMFFGSDEDRMNAFQTFGRDAIQSGGSYSEMDGLSSLHRIQEVVGDSTRPITAEDLPRLKYLEAVVKETLRLYPPVPLTARKVLEDVKLPSGVTLREGCGVVIHMWTIHRNPLYWGADAELFRPERFLEPTFQHPAQFMPFSYGPRNCLGFRWENRKLFKLYEQLKCGMKSYPVVGHAYMFFGSDEDRMNALQILGRDAVHQGGVSAFLMSYRLFIMVADPVIAEFVLKTCLEKDDILKFTQVIIGNGSIFAPVAIWRPRRKILPPNFSPRNLNRFMSVFSKQSDILAAQLRATAGSGPFSVWNYMTTYTMDSICETTFGIQIHAQTIFGHPLLKAFDAGFKLIAARLVQPWLYSNMVYKLVPSYRRLKKIKFIVKSFIDQMVKSKREQICEDKEKKNHPHQDQNVKQDHLKTFLELLIESSGGDRGYSNLELQEETMVIIIAGTDTSAVGAAFTTVMLSQHRNVQEKVYEEIQEVFGDSTRPITTEDLPRLKYLDAVVKESLRLYPPVPVTARKVLKDVTLPSGVTLRKGCGIVINIWAIHRNPLYWGADAELFRPERFLEPTFQHPAQFMPFSYGSRNCLGQQFAMMSMKTALATLLRHYRVLPAGPGASSGHTHSAPDKDKPLRVRFNIIMKDVDNFVVRLESRI